MYLYQTVELIVKLSEVNGGSRFNFENYIIPICEFYIISLLYLTFFDWKKKKNPICKFCLLATL